MSCNEVELSNCNSITGCYQDDNVCKSTESSKCGANKACKYCSNVDECLSKDGCMFEYKKRHDRCYKALPTWGLVLAIVLPITALFGLLFGIPLWWVCCEGRCCGCYVCCCFCEDPHPHAQRVHSVSTAEGMVAGAGLDQGVSDGTEEVVRGAVPVPANGEDQVFLPVSFLPHPPPNSATYKYDAGSPCVQFKQPHELVCVDCELQRGKIYQLDMMLKGISFGIVLKDVLQRSQCGAYTVGSEGSCFVKITRGSLFVGSTCCNDNQRRLLFGNRRGTRNRIRMELDASTHTHTHTPTLRFFVNNHQLPFSITHVPLERGVCFALLGELPGNGEANLGEYGYGRVGGTAEEVRLSTVERSRVDPSTACARFKCMGRPVDTGSGSSSGSGSGTAVD